MSTDASVESTRRRLTKRQADTVRALTEAAEAELLEVGYADFAVRGVASRAGVSTATAYTYFSSKNHLITEVFWRKLATLSTEPDTDAGATERVVTFLRELALLMAGEPALATALTSALLGTDPDVAHLRLRIGGEIRRRLEAALGEGFDPAVRNALEFAYAGALMQAGTGATSYAHVADQLATTARLILGERP